MLRFFCLIGLLFSFSSCKDFVVEKLELSQLQSERLSEIDWAVVDGLPSPPGCDGLENSQAFSPCVMNFLSHALSADQQLLRALRTAFGDTLHLQLVVDAQGVVRVGYRSNQNELNAAEADYLRALDSLISSEPWTPGIKRGVPVQVIFDYALVLKDAD